jgi:cell division protein FtsW (lipid II flippase)
VDFLGIPIPDEGPVFLVAVVIHILAGLVSVATGIGAMVSRKGGRAHITFGRIYLAGIIALFATMAVLAVIRWPLDNHLAILGLIALVAALYGFINRRRHGADRWHILAMGGSYVVMLTAFYVDNGPFLPIWNLLPSWTFWVIPSIVGAPLIARAIVRRSSPARRSSD